MSDARAPVRIQRKRTKGWRMPENAVYVGRPSRWGNPFKVGMALDLWDSGERVYVRDAAQACELYREHCDWWSGSGASARRVAEQLRGKDLVCWCPLDQPCHADVLLEWANAEVTA